MGACNLGFRGPLMYLNRSARIFALNLKSPCRMLFTNYGRTARFDTINSLVFSGRVPRRSANSFVQSVVDSAPVRIRSYLRLIRFDKPIGIYVIFWPAAWSLALASTSSFPDPYLLALFGLGAWSMRASGCIINDLWDKDLDRKVSRTADRPLASNQLSNLQALMALSGTLTLSLSILLQLNFACKIIGASAMLLVITYPLAKRFTYWPQLMLGVTLNWGVFLGWLQEHGSFENFSHVIPLYLACVFYTMFYDTIYAHQDKADDRLIGVKSTALKFGDSSKLWLNAFSGFIVSNLFLTGWICDQTWPFYFGVAGFGAHLAYQVFRVDLNDAESCWRNFKSNALLSCLFFFAIVAGNFVKSRKKNSNSSTDHS